MGGLALASLRTRDVQVVKVLSSNLHFPPLTAAPRPDWLRTAGSSRAMWAETWEESVEFRAFTVCTSLQRTRQGSLERGCSMGWILSLAPFPLGVAVTENVLPLPSPPLAG